MISHDTCVCWRCKKNFGFMCVPGHQSFVGIGGFSVGQVDDGPAKCWGRCPACQAELGAMALPTVFCMGMGMTLLSPGVNPSEGNAGAVATLQAEAEYDVDDVYFCGV